LLRVCWDAGSKCNNGGGEREENVHCGVLGILIVAMDRTSVDWSVFEKVSPNVIPQN
jgi:hypothetical protein